MTLPLNPRHLAERVAERLGSDAAYVDRVRPDPAASAPAGEPLGLATLARGDLQVGTSRRSRIAEEYTVLAAQLMRHSRAKVPAGTGGAPSNLLMVTSTQPGEGKSFTSINLAASLAQNRHTSVLLIDGDPKPGSLSALLGLSDRPGLFDLAENPTLPPEQPVLPTEIDGLSILPVGRITETYGFAAKAARVLHRLARARPDHLLILDAPPTRATSDPSLWSSEVGQILMVIEAERTQRADLERALALIGGCPHILLTLNKTRFDASPGFGAYGYYGV